MEYQDIVTNVKNGVIQTPAYIFDIDVLRRRLSMIREILGETAKMCYAIKANPFLVSPMDDLAPKYEVCSPGELEICRGSGIAMDKVVFSGINKTAASVQTAAQYGVGVMTVESLHHFNLIAACAASNRRTIRVLLRLTNGSQFGMNEADIEQLIADREQYPFVHILGIQYFTGTQKKKSDHIIEELEYTGSFCARLRDVYGYRMEQFEYGTGLWVPYFTKDSFENEFTDLIRIRDYFAAKNYPYEIILEMGRYPVASCGYFATRVEDCKTNKGDNYCIIDAGIHQINYYGQNMALKTPLIDHYPMHPVNDEEPKKWMMCGSLCTFNDVVARNLPVQDLRIGDYFIFHHIGAYSVSEGGYLFLSRDLPNIYFADSKNGIRMVRKGIPSHILNTPDFSGKRLDHPVAPVLTQTVKAQSIVPPAPSSAVLQQQEKDTQAPRLNVPNRPIDDGLDVIGMSRPTASAPVTRAAAPVTRSAAPHPARTPKRFVPETNVLKENKQAQEAAAARATSQSRTASGTRNTNSGKAVSPAAGVSRRPDTASSAAGRTASNRSASGRTTTGRTADMSGQRSNRQSEGARRSSARKKKQNRMLPILIGAAVVLIVAGLAMGIYFGRRVVPSYDLEAGTQIRTSDLLRYKGDKKKNNFALPGVDISAPGEYPVDIRLAPFTYHSTVTVKDTKAPTAAVRDVTAWYGSTVSPEDFIEQMEDATEITAAFASEPDMRTCGEQEITIILTDTSGNKTELTANLTVSGTKPAVEIGLGEELPDPAAYLAEEFLAILEAQGIGADQIAYAEEPAIDTSVPGEYRVNIQAGEESLVSTLVIKDTEAPSVFADDIHVTVGSTVSYKKAIRAYDNVDAYEDLTIDVARDGVDLNTEGEYTYTATVTDKNGNSASDSGTIYVLPAGSEVADIDEVNTMADEILAEILEDGMTKKEQLKAIYNWIRKNTRYSGHAQEEDYTLGAYQGFTEHAGDCFTYAAQAKFLLTRAGIENIDVVKVVPEGSTDIPTHFWNLVNIGEGWYHYDVTPRKDGSTFFYITDKELAKYSDSHNGTHKFNHDLYPEIQ